MSRDPDDLKETPDPSVGEIGAALIEQIKSGVDLLSPDLEWSLDTFEERERATDAQRREIPSWMDGSDLSQTGWGVLFGHDVDWQVRDALQPLLEHRERQVKRPGGQGCYEEKDLRRGWTADRYLRFERGVAPGIIDTKRIPYYILLVGGPESISFEFQYQLSLQFAVGRLWLKKPEDYKKYVDSVLKAEPMQPTYGPEPMSRRACFFAVDDDAPTEKMKEEMVVNLLKNLTRPVDWTFDLTEKEQATKEELLRLLSGGEAPDFLMFTGHGHKREPGAKNQRTRQGALVARGAEDDPAAATLYANDLNIEGSLDGMIAFLLACYSGGTPAISDFPHWRKGLGDDTTFRMRDDLSTLGLSEDAFLARLPQKLLAAGAGAVIGHIDRAWSLTFRWVHDGKTAEAYRSLEDTLRELFRGQRIGHAMRSLNRRYATIAADLAETLKDVQVYGAPSEEAEERAFRRLGTLWTACNDARNFVVLGDPAVRLPGMHVAPWSGRTRKEEDRPVYLPEDLLRQLKVAADSSDVTVEELLRNSFGK